MRNPDTDTCIFQEVIPLAGATLTFRLTSPYPLVPEVYPRLGKVMEAVKEFTDWFDALDEQDGRLPDKVLEGEDG